MKTRLTLIKHAVIMLLLSALNHQLSSAYAQGTTFTYQGSLRDGGGPANGTNYDMVFALYDAPTNGNLFNKLEINSVSVSNGVFTVPLDYGANFPGADRWLEISVQKNGGGFSTLTPRQKLTPTPYAITAANLSGSLPAGQLTGTIPSSSIAGPYTSAVTLNNPANNFTGAFIGNGAGLTNIPTSGTAWQLTGNAGTTAGVNFLGTTDNQPLELKVNGLRALRLEPTANDANHSGIVNVVGGSPANYVVPGTLGAVIAGGGALNYFGGGFSNSVGANFSSIGGGEDNVIQPGGGYSTIGGGANNAILSSNLSYTYASTISGGGGNRIQGGLFEANYYTIGGGSGNSIEGGFDSLGFSTISGGENNTIQRNASVCTIGGGGNNTIHFFCGYSTIGGGVNNTNSSSYATVPGGDQNVASYHSFAAGHRAKANNTGTFVWADSTDVDFASTADNQFLIRASGGVGIGTASPDATLSVNGTADKPGGGAWTVFSDARLKKNIEPLKGALERLLELRAVTFEYKEPQSIHELPGVQIGMIAQEVEKVFPDWVDTAPNGMKRLSIHGFEALTVQALRELRAEKDAKISDLEKQLAAQKELNRRMAARFDALEKAVARLDGQPTATLAVNQDAAK